MAHRRLGRRIVAAALVLASAILFPARILATEGARMALNRSEGAGHCKKGNPPIDRERAKLPNEAPPTADGARFGNVCRIAPGGRTLGFWSSRSGQALLTLGDLEALRDLALVDGDGSDFDPATKKEYAEWLLGATATNMAYMLSAQLSATYLSSIHGFTSTSVFVDGTLTVLDVLVYADALLVADAEVPAGDPSRAEEERVKNLLDAINNGASFVQPTEDACPLPAFL